MTITIRAFDQADWPALWPILQAEFASGETYTFAPSVAEAEVFDAWIATPQAVYVACDAAGQILASYYLKANQSGNGDHVCNCGYVVAAAARGRGVATLMCEHSEAIAADLGFQAMQFNFVVATNRAAISLWRRLGFDIVGTLPRAFRHPQHGLVDAHVMYKWLAEEGVTG